MLNYVATDSTVQIVFLLAITVIIVVFGVNRYGLASKRLSMMESNADRKWKLDRELLEFQHRAIEHKPSKKQSEHGESD